MPFKKGQSGNPGGRPKSSRNYLKKMGQVVSLKDWEEITRRAVADAKKGDRHAREWLSGYLIGKPKESVDLNVKEAPPIQFINVKKPKKDT